MGRRTVWIALARAWPSALLIAGTLTIAMAPEGASAQSRLPPPQPSRPAASPPAVQQPAGTQPPAATQPAANQTAASEPAANQAADNSVGSVATVQAPATDTRKDTTSALKVGDSIFKGDVLQTGQGGALGITFDDESTFKLSANARIVVDELVYSEGGKNSAVFNVSRGVVAFVAGKAAKTGDMKIVTPTATLGVRGTTGVIEVPEGADTRHDRRCRDQALSGRRRARRADRGVRARRRAAWLSDARIDRVCNPARCWRSLQRGRSANPAAADRARPRARAAGIHRAQRRTSDGDPAAQPAAGRPAAAGATTARTGAAARLAARSGAAASGSAARARPGPRIAARSGPGAWPRRTAATQSGPRRPAARTRTRARRRPRPRPRAARPGIPARSRVAAAAPARPATPARIAAAAGPAAPAGATRPARSAGWTARAARSERRHATVGSHRRPTIGINWHATATRPAVLARSSVDRAIVAEAGPPCRSTIMAVKHPG